MTGLTDQLASLGATRTGPPSESTVAADLSRGRAALRRNRIYLGGAVTAAALALAGTAGYLGASSAAAPHHRHVAAQTQQHGTAAPTRSKIKLVDFTGQQPPGFKITSVPRGFGLQKQASSGFSFILAPPGADKNPGSFSGKLVVTAEAASELGKWQSFGDHSVRVNSSRGRLGDDGTATQLWFDAGHGVVVDVQAWDSIGLTHQQLNDFADGVTTTPSLQLSHG
jgi:hypothetical protein